MFDGVAVRMYEPVERSGVLSGIMYFHGGGFVFGNFGKNCGKLHTRNHIHTRTHAQTSLMAAPR